MHHQNTQAQQLLDLLTLATADTRSPEVRAATQRVLTQLETDDPAQQAGDAPAPARPQGG
jgi:hypothetical protein